MVLRIGFHKVLIYRKVSDGVRMRSCVTSQVPACVVAKGRLVDGVHQR